MKRFLCILFLSLCALAFSAELHAQFKSEAFSQQYNADDPSAKDSADVLFSFKEYFGGLRHRNELKIGAMAAGSAVFLGGCQIYNRDYWKLPLVYAGIGGGIGAGLYFNKQGRTDIAKWCFIGAGAAWWASLMDGVISYDTDRYPLPGKATLYAILVPGLGQIYNGEAWKVPVYWGVIAGGVHFFMLNRTNYLRFRNIYREATDEETPYTGPISKETALYYRNVYREYRDYSILAIAAGYLLQIIDANVFAYMHDFDVSDDITLNITPTVMSPVYAQRPAMGVRFGLSF